MRTKTRPLEPLLQIVLDALPERIRKQVDKRGPSGQRGQYMDIPCVGFLEVRFDGSHECNAEAVSLHFQGTGPLPRSRRYPIRKDGTLNLKAMFKIVEERFDARMKWLADYDAERRKSDEEFREARRLGPILFKKVRTGRGFRKEDEERLAGGFYLFHKESGRKTEVWAQTDGTCSGSIPFADLPVEKLNEILKILSQA